jgi:hypothetical protein
MCRYSLITMWHFNEYSPTSMHYDLPGNNTLHTYLRTMGVISWRCPESFSNHSSKHLATLPHQFYANFVIQISCQNLALLPVVKMKISVIHVFCPGSLGHLICPIRIRLVQSWMVLKVCYIFFSCHMSRISRVLDNCHVNVKWEHFTPQSKPFAIQWTRGIQYNKLCNCIFQLLFNWIVKSTI